MMLFQHTQRASTISVDLKANVQKFKAITTQVGSEFCTILVAPVTVFLKMQTTAKMQAYHMKASHS